MNNECNGDYFQVDNKLYYRCFYDGATLTLPYIKQNATCSNCNRPIDAPEVKIISRRLVQQVLLEQEGEWIDLPSS